MWYSRISKLAASSISKRFTCKTHPTLNRNASFSSLVGLKSQISSKNGYTNYPKNLYLVKHYHNSGVHKWYKNILESPKKTSSPEGRIVTHNRIIFLLVSVLAVVVTFFAYRYSEKIPYTNRTHIVFAPPFWDTMFGDGIFERVMNLCKTLSEEHPDSVRVKMIGEQIVEALESDLKAMNNQNVSVDHLRGFIWKFIVVDDPTVSAYGIPGGKIFVSTGLLKKLESDAEIATIIGHEVGHAVARHIASKCNRLMLALLTRSLLGLDLSKFDFIIDPNPHGHVSKWIRVLFQYPNWLRQESEADDIGLLIMASAGYDPQEAPKVYEMYGKFQKSHFYCTHPSGKKRAINLNESKVMDKARSIYSKAIETRKMNDLKDRLLTADPDY